MTGAGAVTVERGPKRSVVTRLRAESPLRLLTPRNAGDAAWIYAATLGGGLLPGDRLALDVEVGRGASSLLGTQSQTRVFRAGAGGGATQTATIRVGDGALFVWLADPVVAFAGARWSQALDLHLDGGSAIVVEGLTAGRAARGERWAFRRFASRTRVFAPELTVEDALLLDPDRAPMDGRFGAFATVMALGPRAAPVAERLRRAPLRASPVVAASEVAGGVVARVGGVGTEAVGGALRELLADLPALLGDDPLARKW